MTWVDFLSNKSQVFFVFKKFKALVEKQSGYQLKTFRSDNGNEYTSFEFDKFCEDASIAHQLTIPYTPQQNGVAERKNRNIMEMARCMLYEKKLPMNFWAEAVNTTVYLLNGLPTKAVKGTTPIEAWCGLKPFAHYLKVFGSICYCHVPFVNRTKLDAKVEPSIFVGYATKSKGYRIYNMATEKVIVHRDVQFDENSYWDWNKKEVVKAIVANDDAKASKKADQNLFDDSEVASIDAY
ncbi:hypothetical protein SLA2020_113170 [Shorea laevis]